MKISKLMTVAAGLLVGFSYISISTNYCTAMMRKEEFDRYTRSKEWNISNFIIEHANKLFDKNVINQVILNQDFEFISKICDTYENIDDKKNIKRIYDEKIKGKFALCGETYTLLKDSLLETFTISGASSGSTKELLKNNKEEFYSFIDNLGKHSAETIKIRINNLNKKTGEKLLTEYMEGTTIVIDKTTGKEVKLIDKLKELDKQKSTVKKPRLKEEVMRVFTDLFDLYINNKIPKKLDNVERNRLFDELIDKMRENATSKDAITDGFIQHVLEHWTSINEPISTDPHSKYVDLYTWIKRSVTNKFKPTQSWVQIKTLHGKEFTNKIGKKVLQKMIRGVFTSNHYWQHAHLEWNKSKMVFTFSVTIPMEQYLRFAGIRLENFPSKIGGLPVLVQKNKKTSEKDKKIEVTTMGIDNTFVQVYLRFNDSLQLIKADIKETEYGKSGTIFPIVKQQKL